MMAFGLRPEKIWQWMAVVYLWGFYCVLSSISSVLLKYATPTNPMGTKRPAAARVNAKQLMEAASNADSAAAEAAVGSPNEGGVLIDVGPSTVKRLGAGAKSSAKESFQLGSMPFTPATLSWKELKYTVYIGKEKTPRVLLNNISGYAEPGKLTALMGSSGAVRQHTQTVRCVAAPAFPHSG